MRDVDERMGAFLATVARLERETNKQSALLRRLDSEVHVLQTNATDISKLATEIRTLGIIRKAVVALFLATLGSIGSFIVMSIRNDERLQTAREELTALRGRQEVFEKSISTVDGNVRSLLVELHESRKAIEKWNELTEQRLQRIEDRRRR